MWSEEIRTTRASVEHRLRPSSAVGTERSIAQFSPRLLAKALPGYDPFRRRFLLTQDSRGIRLTHDSFQIAVRQTTGPPCSDAGKHHATHSIATHHQEVLFVSVPLFVSELLAACLCLVRVSGACWS